MMLLATALALALSGSAQSQHTATPADRRITARRLIRKIQKPDRQTQSVDPPDQNADPQDQKAEAKEPPTPPHTGIRALVRQSGRGREASARDAERLHRGDRRRARAGRASGRSDVQREVDEFNHYVNAFSHQVNALGDTPEQVAFSIGTYAVGRLRDQPKVAHLGMDLRCRRRSSARLLVEPIKFAVHRERPTAATTCRFRRDTRR